MGYGSFRLVSRNKVGRNQLFPVLIEIEVLRTQIDLDIGGAVVGTAQRSGFLREFRRALRLGARCNRLAKPAFFCVLVDLPAVGTAFYRNGCAPSGFKALRLIIGVILRGKRFDKLVQLAVVQLYAALAIRRDPTVKLLAGQNDTGITCIADVGF